MIFEKGDKARVKKSAGTNGGKIYTIKSISDDGYVNVDEKVDSIGDGWLQLILESPKLTLRLFQHGLKLKIKILHQDGSLRGSLYLNYKEFSMMSDCGCDFVDGVRLYIKGSDSVYDTNKISYTYSS